MTNSITNNSPHRINLITPLYRWVTAKQWARSAPLRDVIAAISASQWDLVSKSKAGEAIAYLRNVNGTWTEVAEWAGLKRSSLYDLRRRLQVEEDDQDVRGYMVCRLPPVLVDLDVTEDIHEAFEHLRERLVEDDASDLILEALADLGSILGFVEEEEDGDDMPSAA